LIFLINADSSRAVKTENHIELKESFEREKKSCIY